MTDVVDRDPKTLTRQTLAAWAWQRQGLDGSAESLSPAEILSRHGWARSVGGSNPYMSLYARGGITRTAAEQAVAEQDIHELPSARGCAYVLGKGDFSLALHVGRDSGAPELRVLEKLGVPRGEVEKLADTIHATLSAQGRPLDPATLKDLLGPAVRNLGDAGKKKGSSTTLPAALGLLQRAGRIRRIPNNGRLDQQRFAYVAWDLPASTNTDEQARAALLRRYLSWTGGATLKDIQWFTGFTVAHSKKALAALDTLQFTTAEGEVRVLLAEDAAALEVFESPEEVQIKLLASLDSIVLLRRNTPELIADPAVAEEVMNGAWGLSADLSDHPIMDRGLIIGLWQYNPDAERVVAWLFPGLSTQQPQAAQQQIEQVGDWIRAELGDFRSTSMDSVKNRQRRFAYLQEQARLQDQAR